MYLYKFHMFWDGLDFVSTLSIVVTLRSSLVCSLDRWDAVDRIVHSNFCTVVLTEDKLDLWLGW